MSHRHHENIVILYLINLEGFQSKLQVVVHALYFQLCPCARQCDIVKLVNPFLQARMNIEDLFLASLVETPSIYHPCVGIFISIKEVTINCLYRELSTTILFYTLCNIVVFGPKHQTLCASHFCLYSHWVSDRRS